MVEQATIAGAVFGLVTQLYSNGLRKVPLMRHPWEHLLLMGIGVVAANQLVKWEKYLEVEVAKTLDEGTDMNRRRFAGTRKD